MKLLTQEIIKKLPALYATENVKLEDKKIITKFFNPYGAGKWYAVEYDPIDKMFFGLVDLHEKELGYFTLAELENYRFLNQPWGKIERDLYFDGKTLKDVL